MVKSVDYNREIPQKMKSELRNKREASDDSGIIDEMAREFAKRTAQHKQANTNISLNTLAPPTSIPTPRVREDSFSTGKFGWEEVKQWSVSIPYILRAQYKYVPQRIVYHKVFKNFIPNFSPEVFECIRMTGVNLTISEARLLDEINFTHCDSSFGKTKFTTADNLISLQAFRDAHNFLLTCFTMLLLENANNGICGFMRIDKENIVPYVYVNGKKALPTFYFDGESEYLQSKSFYMPPKEMMYLRFCCALQQIRKEHYDMDSCKAIYLEDLKLLFPNSTKFENFWPDELNFNMLTPFGRQRCIEKLGFKRPKLKIVMHPYYKRVECLLRSPTTNRTDHLPWPLPAGWKNPYSRIVHLLDIDIPQELSVPYSTCKIAVFGHINLYGINLNPYENAPSLISLKEVHIAYFNFTHWHTFIGCINLLGFTLFTLNKTQLGVFRAHTQDVDPGYFVQVDELTQNMETFNLIVTNGVNRGYCDAPTKHVFCA